MVTGKSWKYALVDGDKVRDLHEIHSFFNTSIVLEEDKVSFRTLSSANFVSEEGTEVPFGRKEATCVYHTVIIRINAVN